MKKVIYVFHGNGNSFNMIFITIIQPKTHKHRFYFKLFHFKIFLRLGGHNSKKKLHIFFQKQSHILFFLISFRSSRTFLKKNMKYFQKQPHIFLETKNMSCTFPFRTSRTFFKKHWNIVRGSRTIFNIKNKFKSSCTKNTHFAWRFS